MGYYHALFMWAELSFVIFFWGQWRSSAGRIRARSSRSASRSCVLCVALFLRLLFADYGYIR